MDLPNINFEGQSVIFYMSSPQWWGEGVVINSPTFQTEGGRLFVVGKAPKGSDWGSERLFSIAWDSVIQYVVIPTDEYEAEKLAESTSGENVTCEPSETPKAKFEVGKSGKTSMILIGIVIPIAVIVFLVAWTYRILMG